MSSIADNNKRIAKNTMMLYARMLFSMLVSLYTTRVVLETLGVEDFGISNIVGGFVGMMSFLNSSMASATSRFLTFELGKGNVEKLKYTFSTAMIIHIVLASVVLLFAETIGLWLFETQLVIPENRLWAARIVYQFSILGMLLSITQSPYDGVLVAHEKFDVYAYLGMLNVGLRLLIVYILVIGCYDKLVLYAVLQLCVSVFMIGLSRWYCIRHFSETKFTFIYNPKIIKPMLSFSGLDLFGNLSVMARTQGVNILLNIFFGPILNAAAGIATSVQSAVMSMAGNVVSAVRPQIVKSYAIGKYDSMFLLLRYSMKLCFVLLAFFTIPLMTETHFILKVWLKNVPEYSVILCKYTLLFNFFANMSLLLGAIIHATGRIKRISLINGSLYILVIPFSYVAFKLGSDAWLPYLFNVIAVFIGLISNAWTIHLYIKEFAFRKFVTNDIIPCIIVFSVVYLLANVVSGYFIEGWLRVVIITLMSCLLISVFSIVLLFNKIERGKIVMFIKKKICQVL